MLLANFNGKEHLRHRAVSLRQHGFLVAFIYVYIDDRPTDHRPLISKISTATGRPIHFMFGSRVGFSGTADLTALFRFEKIQYGCRRHLGKISNDHISATDRPILFKFGSRLRFSGTADLTTLLSRQASSRGNFHCSSCTRAWAAPAG